MGEKKPMPQSQKQATESASNEPKRQATTT
jgi:hypothetical protein